MSSIGNVIESAVNVATGSSPGTSLKDFLSKFSSAEGKWVDTIDPFSTFDLTIKFHPTISASSSGKKGMLEKLGSNLMSAAKGAVKSLANNVTGGLLGSIMNSNVKIMQQHDSFDKAHECTFLEYLAAANLLVGSEDWIGEKAGQVVRPLEL